MTRVFWLFVFLLACSLSALAQLNSLHDPNQWTPESSGLATDKPQIRGCIAMDESGKGFVLTNQQYEKGVPVVSSKDLAGQVGHTVELTGAWKKVASATGTSATKNEKVRAFNASKVRELAAKCVAVPKDNDLGIRTSIVNTTP